MTGHQKAQHIVCKCDETACWHSVTYPPCTPCVDTRHTLHERQILIDDLMFVARNGNQTQIIRELGRAVVYLLKEAK